MASAILAADHVEADNIAYGVFVAIAVLLIMAIYLRR